MQSLPIGHLLSTHGSSRRAGPPWEPRSPPPEAHEWYRCHQWPFRTHWSHSAQTDIWPALSHTWFWSHQQQVGHCQSARRWEHQLRTCQVLSSQVFEGLDIKSPVSDMGSPLLQVFPDFVLQSAIMHLQPPHPLQVWQAVFQAQYSLLLGQILLMCIDQGPSLQPRLWTRSHPRHWWRMTQRSGSRASHACLHTVCTVGWPDPMPRWLHGAQNPATGEAGASAEAHVVWGGRQVSKTQCTAAFPVLLKYNWHKTMYYFKVYNIIIWYMYILHTVTIR